MSNKIYVSERVVNIADLERIIAEARFITASLLSNIEKNSSFDRNNIQKGITRLDVLLHEAEAFEFCVERRSTVDTVT